MFLWWDIVRDRIPQNAMTAITDGLKLVGARKARKAAAFGDRDSRPHGCDAQMSREALRGGQ